MPGARRALVVLGAPLVIDGDGFKPAGTDLFSILQEICGEIRKTPMERARRPVAHGL